jgi:hypothetical protein
MDEGKARTKWPDVFHEDIEGWFKEGVIQADIDERNNLEKSSQCPYLGELSRHWWTRGYAYQARLYRAIRAEMKGR